MELEGPVTNTQPEPAHLVRLRVRGKRYTKQEWHAVVMVAAERVLGTEPPVSWCIENVAEQAGMSPLTIGRRYGTRSLTPMLKELVDYTDEAIDIIIEHVKSYRLPAKRTAARIVAGILTFVEKNRGLARLLAGDHLLRWWPEGQERMDNLLTRIGAAIGQHLMDLLVGRLRRFVSSGFRRSPTDNLDEVLNLIDPLY